MSVQEAPVLAPGSRAETADVPASGSVQTPTVRAFFRRSRFWIIAAVAVIITAIVFMVFNNSGSARDRSLDAQDPSPTGSKAIATVLSNRGINVTVARTYEEALSALRTGESTLLFADEGRFLDAERTRNLTDRADRTVLVNPGYTTLDAVDSPITPAGSAGPDATLPLACTLPAAERAGSISSGPVYSPGEGTACFGTAESGFSLVISPDQRITVLGPAEVLRNESILERGNAALAIGLLGETPNLVWYLPTAADLVANGGGTTFAEATPRWLSPVLWMLILTAVTAALWRGRRFGALVGEDLPVSVPAAETRHGRARLYQRVGARTRALDALRIGTMDRLATRLGLPRQTPADAVSNTLADRLRIPRAEVYDLLIARAVRSEAELVHLAQELGRLEAAAADALDPTSPGTGGFRAGPHTPDPRPSTGSRHSS
ncbi:DUF4350 domain-containing protein [Mycetocola tolaasinivorans]|uniref:DUF4350 domain-containing protein n=1 Tax=Mycetocola tolaasinivorans TaxID=76635 RepID=A0A3L7A6S5_9MICO|nr:DUF4350 domain-containing protein [Mycetocola tolaasinivorans]RLP76036.1 DUF4350 domain-containing protein [Mycetocola tolaasinivorans]